MEHNDAVRLQAVEKYILGELSPAVRDDFEDHYFDCAVCAFNIRTGVAFAAGTRQFFAEPPAPMAHKAGWLSWLKPMVAAPLMAGLLLIIGYQQFASRSSSEVLPWYSLNDASVHGSEGTRIEAQRGKAFRLFLDIPSAAEHPDKTWLVQIQSPTGHVVSKKSIPSHVAQKAVILDMPANFEEGKYKALIFEQSAAVPVDVVSFTVAFSSQIQQH